MPREDMLILTVPGLHNSGPGHWQTIWEQARDNCRRVELGLWDRPHRNTWVNALNLAIRAADRPVVLAAHSLGCMAVAWWAQLERPAPEGKVKGALLVAPPAVDHRPHDPRVATFAPTPRIALPFPSILVGSHDDPYMGFRAARALARLWGCGFADAGKVGHINTDSGLGDWAFGQFLLDRLIPPAEPRPACRPGWTASGTDGASVGA
ncbi:MAG: alpha/beta hydrolase [Sphingomonadales bacterium]|nr:alpha/beta hydrolase [Sphingomonadales bacterium]